MTHQSLVLYLYFCDNPGKDIMGFKWEQLTFGWNKQQSSQAHLRIWWEEKSIALSNPLKNKQFPFKVKFLLSISTSLVLLNTSPTLVLFLVIFCERWSGNYATYMHFSDFSKIRKIINIEALVGVILLYSGRVEVHIWKVKESRNDAN